VKLWKVCAATGDALAPQRTAHAAIRMMNRFMMDVPAWTRGTGELSPHCGETLSSNRVATHRPGFNPHLTKSRLNGAPHVCEMTVRNLAAS
jgi:hypothetical protein